MLRTLYADLPEDAWWYLWTLAPDNRRLTHWFNDLAACEQAVSKLLPVINVYYPIAWTKECGTEKTRATYDTAAGIVGFVSDLDIKEHCFPNEEVAIEAVSQFPLQPTACIHSGHGLQCVWLFKEPWEFSDVKEKEEARDLSRGWAHKLARIAHGMGYELDAVHDLTRIMRLPGTMNVKDPLNPVPVTIKWLDDNTRYNPEDFEPFIASPPVSDVSVVPLPQVDIGADFPKEKFALLMAWNREFRDTVEHKRKFRVDNSCSAYDMALANITVEAGWTDDEITALLAQNQRDFGTKKNKDKDARYFAKTIQAARAWKHNEAAKIEAKTAKQEAEAVVNQVIEAGDEEDKLKLLAEFWKIPLTKIQIVTGDPAIYRFWINGRVAEVSALRMDTQKAFITEVLSVSRRLPVKATSKSKPTWEQIVNIIGEVAEILEVGDDATRDGSLTSLIEEFFESRTIADIDDIQPSQRLNTPFLSEGYVYFRLVDFMAYLNVHDKELAGSRKILIQKLKAIGADRKTFATGTGDNQTSGSFFGIKK